MQIQVDPQAIADFCRRNHIRKLALFGSVLRDDFRPESDVDVLVEFEPGRRIGYDFIRIQNEMSGLFSGHPIDLGTGDALHPLIRERVLRDARVIFPG